MDSFVKFMHNSYYVFKKISAPHNGHHLILILKAKAKKKITVTLKQKLSLKYGFDWIFLLFNTVNVNIRTSTKVKLLQVFYHKIFFSLIIDCVLGPNEDDAEKDDISSIRPTRLPAALSLSHSNAFHVWDQDDVVIPLPSDDSPQMSPLLLAAIPYIPSFFPTSSSNNSPSVPNSPGPTSTIPRDV